MKSEERKMKNGVTGASASGGGVYADCGGIIYANSAAQSNGGHTVYVNSSPVKRRETTAGPGVNLLKQSNEEGEVSSGRRLRARAGAVHLAPFSPKMILTVLGISSSLYKW